MEDGEVKVRLTLDVPRWLVEQLDAQAKAEGLARADVMRLALRASVRAAQATPAAAAVTLAEVREAA